jgi:hypothetical protein
MQASKRMRRTLLATGLAGTAILGVGCSNNELETGYKFQRLGSSTATQRRAFYAGPFSPEAREAMLEGNGDAQSAQRRPRPGM